METSSTLVIKVKYGDMLRRFSSQIVNGELKLNADTLRKKIISLFNLDADAELMLTYIDEDGDVVTLVDDDDICDVVKQALNPLRLTVKLGAAKSSMQDTRSTGSSTPLRSPRVRSSMQNINSDVSRLLGNLPEPAREMLVRIANNLARRTSSASSSAPVVAELVDYYLTLGLSYLDQHVESQPGVQSPTQSGVPESVAAAESKDGELVNDDSASAWKALKSELSSKINESSDGAAMKNEEVNIPSVTGGSLERSDFDFNAEVPNYARKMNAVQPGYYTLLNPAPAPASASLSPGAPKIVGNKEKAKKVVESFSNGKSHLATDPLHVASSTGKTDGSSITSDLPSTAKNDATREEVNNLKEPKLGSGHSNVGVSDPKNRENADVKQTSVLPENFGKSPVSMWASGPVNEHPFSGIALGNVLAAPPQPVSVPVPFRRSMSENDGSRNVFHRGVRCDGCGIHPIVGPRFKSKVKVDYDLCSTCFEEFGNEIDYIRMDFPMAYRSHVPFKGFPGAAKNRRLNLPQVYRGSKVKSAAAKLDSRFIQDVNVFDGTVMPPSTPFTKIWRMRNTGTLGWPQGTQLVWIGGDKLSSAFSVELEIHGNALSTNEEINIAVDFISPDLPGRYISYWRLATPSGSKFGQRVWVLIQAAASIKEVPLENIRNLNLNLPPVSTSTDPQIINVNPEPARDYNKPEFGNSEKVDELLQPNTEQDLKFPINDSLFVGNSSLSSAFSSVSYPIIDLSDVTPALASVPAPVYPLPPPPPPLPTLSAAPVASPLQSEVDLGKNQGEEKLLRELEEMGFKQLDLNKEVLRMNEYNLEQAVDDLCGVTEWDPMLEELQEMGFHNREMNKKLLKKNNGSIKRVVMDLIAGEMN